MKYIEGIDMTTKKRKFILKTFFKFTILGMILVSAYGGVEYQPWMDGNTRSWYLSAALIVFIFGFIALISGMFYILTRYYPQNKGVLE